MPERPVYVYRLEVEHPEGDAPIPASWADQPDSWSWTPQWPAARRYLSQSGAETRARLLRSMGCTVKIVRSQRVVFDA